MKQVAAIILAAHRGAPGHQKSRCNLLQKCNKISGGPARRAGPPEILLQFVATFK